MRLSSSGSRCQGRLEVYQEREWLTVHSQSWGQHSSHQLNLKQFSKLCQELQCGDPFVLSPLRHFTEKQLQNFVICHGQLGSFSNCSRSKGSWVESLALICLGG